MGLATDVQDCRLLCVMSQKLSPNWELVFLLEWESIVLNYKVFLRCLFTFPKPIAPLNNDTQNVCIDMKTQIQEDNMLHVLKRAFVCTVKMMSIPHPHFYFTDYYNCWCCMWE